MNIWRLVKVRDDGASGFSASVRLCMLYFFIFFPFRSAISVHYFVCTFERQLHLLLCLVSDSGFLNPEISLHYVEIYRKGGDRIVLAPYFPAATIEECSNSSVSQ